MRGSIRLGQRCLVQIKDAVFRRDTGKDAIPIFGKKIDKFEIWKPNFNSSSEPGTKVNVDQPSFWAITGPEKSQFLSIASGKEFASPQLSRTYPFISKSFQYDRIAFLDFRDSSGLDKVHLSARYESYSYKGVLEMSDDVNSVRNYIIGSNNYNSNTASNVDDHYVEQLLKLFNLKHLERKWINSLSNGQLRRARLAKALIAKPNLLLIDDPFLGLDPKATELVSASLDGVSKDLGTAVVIGLRVQDIIPEWITHIGYVTRDGLTVSGPKESVNHLLDGLREESAPVTNQKKQLTEIPYSSLEPSHIQFKNASVAYKGLKVLDKFDWNIPAGSKWRILGDNGTGKTTILSLITADHPQSWRSVLAIDGISRKSGSGVTFFDVNNAIGISSPELHALVPGHRTARQIILNGLVKDVGNTNFLFSGETTDFAESILRRFPIVRELEAHRFSELSITHQKLVIFLRAIIKNPRLLILDEAFSCMDDSSLMHQCHDLVEELNTTVLAIGHIDWELPRCDYLLKLVGDEQRSYKIYKYE